MPIERRMAVIGVAVLSLSCSEVPRNELSSQDCIIYDSGKEYFKGSLECISRQPEVPLEGYWVFGFEHSLFYESEEAFRNEEINAAYWLHLDKIDGTDEKEYLNRLILEDDYNYFRIRLRGSIARREGFYTAYYPDLAGGIVANEIENLERIEKP